MSDIYNIIGYYYNDAKFTQTNWHFKEIDRDATSKAIVGRK